MTLQGLGDKTYGLLQVPSQWTILHTSQVLSVSSSKRYIVYTCICVLRFLLKNVFCYMYIFKMGKTIKKKKKKSKWGVSWSFAQLPKGSTIFGCSRPAGGVYIAPLYISHSDPVGKSFIDMSSYSDNYPTAQTNSDLDNSDLDYNNSYKPWTFVVSGRSTCTAKVFNIQEELINKKLQSLD